MSSHFTIEVEQEIDGRWIAEVQEISGALSYGATREEALARVEALALRVVADRLEEETPREEFSSVAFSFA